MDRIEIEPKRRIAALWLMMPLLGGIACWCGCASSSDPGLIAREWHQGHHAVAPAARTATAPDSLLVVSYNIAFALQAEEAAAQLLADPHLARADILLLQEMDLAGTEIVARALGLDYVYGPAYRHKRHGRRWGSAVLSRWPIVGHDSVVLPHPNPFSTNHRRAVAADILVGERWVRAVSVHLSTVVIPLEDRLDQAQVLADSLGAVAHPVIIGGDFNTGSAYEATLVRQLLRRAGFRQVRLPPGKTALGGGLLDTFAHELVLDHLFHRGLKSRRSGIAHHVTASDHFPVWMVVTWPR